MAVAVLTVDQRGSRTSDDRIPATLEALADAALLRPFERTAGDEFQGVLADPAGLAPIVEALLREDAWNVGIGVGAVEEPLPPHANAGRGAAYLYARDAVTSAKNSPWHLRDAGRTGAGDDAVAVGGRAGPAHGSGVAGRRPGRRGPLLRRGRPADRHQPVRRQPA